MNRGVWILGLFCLAACETVELEGVDGGPTVQPPVPTVWTETHVAFPEVGTDHFGDLVAIHGDDVYVAGRTSMGWKLFRLSRNGSDWSVTAEVGAPDVGATVGWRARALVVTEDNVWLGVLSDLSNNGWTAADGEVWRLDPDLTVGTRISAPATRSAFGASVAVSARRVFVGAPGTDRREGAVYVYDRVSLNPTAEMRWPGSTSGSGFGATLATDATRLYVAATEPCVAGACGPGNVLVYAQADGPADTWSLAEVWSNPEPDVSHNFGASIATGGAEGIVVGSPYKESCCGPNGPRIRGGEAYVFTAGSTAARALRPYDAYSNEEQFGFALAAHGPHMVIGAPGDASSVRGEPGTDEGTKGVAYLFTAGEFVERVEPDGANRRDEVASSVAISSDTLVLGAPFADGPDRIDEAGGISIFELRELVETQ